MGAVALAMFAALYLLLTRTRVGIVVRAATYRPTTVEALGHNLPLVYMAVFAGGSAPAGLAGARGRALFPPPPPTGLRLSSPPFLPGCCRGGAARGAARGPPPRSWRC